MVVKVRKKLQNDEKSLKNEINIDEQKQSS